MDSSTYTYTNTLGMHSCKHTKKNPLICRGQSLSRTINFDWSFTETNPAIKRNHNPIKSCHYKNQRERSNQSLTS